MICEKCGYVLGPFDTKCARCEQMRARKSTKRLPDLGSMQTQHLVQLDQCPHCKFLLFPGDAVCSSCGAPVHRPWKRSAPSQHTPRTRQQPPKTFLIGLTVGVILVGMAVLLFFRLMP